MAYRRLMHGESLDGTYDAKILEKEMAETGKNASNEQELVLAKHDAIKSVLEKGMPIMNLHRLYGFVITACFDRSKTCISKIQIQR